MRYLRYFTLLFVFVCTVSCLDRNEDQSVSARMNKIESDIVLSFPANSILGQFSEADVLFDPTWVAKIIIPASSYESFSEAVLAKPDDDTVVFNRLSESTDWWKPANIILEKQYLADQHTLVIVVVSEEESLDVYVECIIF